MIKKKIISLVLVFTIVFSLNIPVLAKTKVQAESALDKRAVQTKIYDTKSKNELMKMALDIMQDENYKILNIDNELGVITAVKQSKRSRPISVKIGYYAGFLAISALSFGIDAAICWVWIKDAHTPYNVEDTITLNIFDLNNKQRKIRISGIEKVMAPHTLDKATLKIIQDPSNEFYTDFFTKLNKEDFIMKQDL